MHQWGSKVELGEGDGSFGVVSSDRLGRRRPLPLLLSLSLTLSLTFSVCFAGYQHQGGRTECDGGQLLAAASLTLHSPSVPPSLSGGWRFTGLGFEKTPLLT